MKLGKRLREVLHKQELHLGRPSLRKAPLVLQPSSLSPKVPTWAVKYPQAFRHLCFCPDLIVEI